MNQPSTLRSLVALNVLLLLGILALAAALVWQNWVASADGPLHDPVAASRTVVARGDLADDEQATIELVKQTYPSVVSIITSAVRRGGFSMQEVPQGAGSGILWDAKGYVLTNFHVIQNASNATVTLHDGTVFSARLVGHEAEKDIAVLKIEPRDHTLQPIQVGSSHDLEIGQKVFAIGSPFGLDHSLSTGVVSGLDREIESATGRLISGMIQTDAAINPGNSGGPLLDSAGRLIGMNTAIFSPTGANAGIGFAVPVDTINRIVPQLIQDGEVEHPVLGIVPNDRLARQMNIEGVAVMQVINGGGAAAAGLRPATFDDTRGVQLGDVITAIAGNSTPTTDDLLDELENHAVGDTVSVTLIRDGQELEIPVVLQAR